MITLVKVSRSRAEFEELFERMFPGPQMRLPLVIEIPDPATQVVTSRPA
ncbi:MAG: hypothetical protein ACRDOK_25950 [Streptosporangiaceae bacterium]